jgi:predicted small integral membrane protein
MRRNRITAALVLISALAGSLSGLLGGFLANEWSWGLLTGTVTLMLMGAGLTAWSAARDDSPQSTTLRIALVQHNRPLALLLGAGVIALAVVAVVAVVALRPPGPLPPTPTSGALTASRQIGPGQAIKSADGHCALAVARNGLLHLLQDGRQVWQPNFPRDHPYAYAVMQADGNFVFYSNKVVARKKTLWASNTDNNRLAYLVVEHAAGQCHFRIFNKSGELLLTRP